MKVRLVIIAVFLLFLSGLATVGGYRAAQNRATDDVAIMEPAAIRCATLQRQTIDITESFYGILRPNVHVDMAFQVAGRISQLGPEPGHILREGDAVTAGQLIAMLEPDRYESALMQAEAEVSRARAALMSAQARVRETQAQLADAQRELDRVSELAPAGAATRRELERAQTAVEALQAVYQSTQSQYEAASAMYDSARAAEAVARVNLQDAKLIAPMDALVAHAPTEIGQFLSSGQLVLSLVDNHKVKLVIGVVERKLPLLARGQEVMVYVEALRAGHFGTSAADAAVRRRGTVTRIPPAADTTTGLFNVEIELANADATLAPGMIAQAVVTLRQVSAVAIPTEAAVRVGDRVRVFFVRDGENTAREVELMPVAFQRDFYMVEDIPTDVGRLVVEGQSRLQDGQHVRILE